jgi:polysaccharide export outer membrane protein
MMSRWSEANEFPLSFLKNNAGSPADNQYHPFQLSKAGLVVLIALLMVVTGCQTFTPSGTNQPTPAGADAGKLREGDILRITFPGASNLDTTQHIRSDGKILLPLIGDMTVTELTVPLLEKELKTRYASQLVSNQVIVTVDSDSFTVYVTGAVVHPGKISASHPLTALEAVMESGGPDRTKANMKKVKVTRREGSHYQPYIVNLQKAMDGEKTPPFYLQSGDIVDVPEKFVLF